MNIPYSGEDCLIWKLDRNGKFTVKNAYNTICSDYVNTQVACDLVPTEIWIHLWKTRVPHRVQLFIWKCIKNIVPVRNFRSRYNHNIDTHCAFCNNNVETLNHLFFECNYSRNIWLGMNINISAISEQFPSLINWIISWYFSANQNIPPLYMMDE